jgi:hypothetical protein
MAARIPSRWRRIARASRGTARAGTGGPSQPRVEVRRRVARVVEVIEEPELFFEKERAVERLVGLLDFAELASWWIVWFSDYSAATRGCP